MRIVQVLARLAFAGFAAALLIALSGGFGKQLGFWTYQTGFRMLEWGVYVGIAALALGLAWAAVAIYTNDGRAMNWGIAGMIGAAVVIGFPVYGYYAAKTVPPIHDITTDIAHPPQFRALLALRKADGAVNPPEYYGDTKITWHGQTKTVAQWQRKYYTDIYTIRILTPPEKLYARALKAAKSMGWDIVAESAKDGHIEATDTTFFFGFTDDIAIRVRPSGMGARLDIRSESRVGRSDIGKNAARIRAYIKELADTKL